jgi:alpha-amylase/alpha-mannosidase (GH57 family)
MREIHHALVLNMHQPPSNLDRLLETNEWEAKEILFAYDRMPRALWNYQDIARVHLSLSGTLLETLSNPSFQERAYGIVDCGKTNTSPAGRSSPAICCGGLSSTVSGRRKWVSTCG